MALQQAPPKRRGTGHRAPARTRCYACHHYFGFEVIDGLYCSRYCAGLPPLRVVAAVPLPPGTDVHSLPRTCRSPHWQRPEAKAKQRYRSLADAEVVAAQQTRPDRPKIGAYKCPNCEYFHIGHEPFQEEAS